MKQHSIHQACLRWAVRSSFCLVALVLSTSAFAANPGAWWVDIKNNRGDEVKTLLAQGADPNAVNEKGQPALMQAIRDGAWDVYDLLVAHRAIKVNVTNATDETPLMYLAVAGETKRAQQLIKRGAQVNRLGWTPLQYAASTGKVDTVKMLIANKAIIDAPSPDGTTALMMAAYAGSEPVLRLLLKAGAEVTAQNLRKQDAADWARLKKHNALAKQLDELTQQTLAERAALHAKNRAQEAAAGGAAGAAGAAGSREPYLDMGNHAAEINSINAEGPTSPVSINDKATEEAGPNTGTSRYFNLDRFEKD
ncbi:MAG TPA: ankyrin repeat domain-containing protein [Eoetvoesiella sp.]